MSGALCFMGTRVPVKSLFEYLEGTSSLEEFLEVELKALLPLVPALEQALLLPAPP